MNDSTPSQSGKELREYREIKLNFELLSPELSSCVVSACAGNGLTGPEANILFSRSQAVIALGDLSSIKKLKENIQEVKDKPATYVAHGFTDYTEPTIENMSLLAQKVIAILMQPDEKFPERSRRAAMHCGEGCGRSGLMTAVLIALEKVLSADESSLQDFLKPNSYIESISNDDERDEGHMASDLYCQLAIDIKKSFTNEANHPYVKYPDVLDDLLPGEYIETGGQLKALSNWVEHLVDIRTEHGLEELIARFNTPKNIDESLFSEDSPYRSAALHYDEAVATNISYPYIERIEAKLQNQGLEAISASELLMATPKGKSVLNKALALKSIEKTQMVKKISPFLLNKYLKSPYLISYLLSERFDIDIRSTVARAIIDNLPKDFSQFSSLTEMLSYPMLIIDDRNAAILVQKYSPEKLKKISYEEFISLISSLESRGDELIKKTFDIIGTKALLDHAITYVKEDNRKDNLVMYQLINNLLDQGNKELLAAMCHNIDILLYAESLGMKSLTIKALNQIATSPNFHSNKAARSSFIVENRYLLQLLIDMNDECPAKQLLLNANIDVLSSAYKEIFSSMKSSQFMKLISEKQYQLAAALMDKRVRLKLPRDISNIDRLNIEIFRERDVPKITRQFEIMSNEDKKQWFNEGGYKTLMQKAATMNQGELEELEENLLPKIAQAIGGEKFVRKMLTATKSPIDAAKKSMKLSLGTDNNRRNSSSA